MLSTLVASSETFNEALHQDPDMGCKHWPYQRLAYWCQEHRELARSQNRSGPVAAPEVPNNVANVVLDGQVGDHVTTVRPAWYVRL